MSEGPGDATQAVVELDKLLLDARLSAPSPRPGSVSRHELIARARASERRVVGVTSPAGYGKSTLLAEWAATEDRPVGWVSLQHLDDDPAMLLTLLASAYTRASSNGTELIADVNGLGVSILGRAAPRLAAALNTSPSPFVLMLDDLHELASPACHDVLGIVISGVPHGSQMVTASRSDQPHLPRLRVSGDAFELEAHHLALDATAAQQIFAGAGVDLAPEAAVTVTERTEGWPVGLYLAALIAREAGDDALSIAGDDRYVADYLYHESLIRLPDATQRFLRCTSVLDQLSGPLCDALLGEPGANEQLRQLEASHLFLVPLDRRRGWYRYHALFREFLLSELRRAEPDLEMKLHLRAADWYEANGSPALALEHVLHTTERARCIQLMTALILPTYQDGQMSVVQRWLSEIGDAAIEDYPPLAVLAGWVAALTGHTADAQRWATIIDRLSFDPVPTDGSASFDSARAMLRSMMCAAGPEQAMIDANFALDAEPAWSPWRDQALSISGEAHLLAGDVDAAVPLFTEASRTAAAVSNTDVLVNSEAELAILAMDRGDWSAAAEHLRVAHTAIDEHRANDYVLSLLAFAASARLAVHLGDRQAGDRHLASAMRARPASTLALPYIAVRLRMQLAKVYLAIGDQATARHLLREIDDIFLHRPALGVLVEQVAELSDLVTSSSGTGSTGGPPLSPAELRLLPYLQTHLTFREIGERLFVSRNTVSSQVGSIYRKLDVSSRNDAVQAATKIGLLGN